MKKIRLLVSFAGAAVLAFIVLADECIAGGKIFTNQIGYLPGASKVFLATQVADSFSVIDIRTGAVRFSSRIELWKANDPASGLTLYKGDFSSLKQKGEYKLRTSSGDSSRVFSISDTVYNPVFRAATKGFYFQRCGMDLLPGYAGPYLHTKCHIGDAYFHSTTGSPGYRQVVGGWHDAGDYNKYVVNAGVTLGTLLMGYELFPDRFASDDLGIPESGNGVPDLLDEVRYELAWLLSMQSANGGVYFKVSRSNSRVSSCRRETPGRDTFTRSRALRQRILQRSWRGRPASIARSILRLQIHVKARLSARGVIWRRIPLSFLPEASRIHLIHSPGNTGTRTTGTSDSGQLPSCIIPSGWMCTGIITGPDTQAKDCSPGPCHGRI